VKKGTRCCAVGCSEFAVHDFKYGFLFLEEIRVSLCLGCSQNAFTAPTREGLNRFILPEETVAEETKDEGS